MLASLNIIFGLMILSTELFFWTSSPESLIAHTYAELFLIASFGIIMFAVGAQIALKKPTTEEGYSNLQQWKNLGFMLILMMFPTLAFVMLPHAHIMIGQLGDIPLEKYQCWENPEMIRNVIIQTFTTEADFSDKDFKDLLSDFKSHFNRSEKTTGDTPIRIFYYDKVKICDIAKIRQILKQNQTKIKTTIQVAIPQSKKAVKAKTPKKRWGWW